MAKFQGSSSLTLKVTAFVSKVPTMISVNSGKSPCKSVKTKNDITSSKINYAAYNKIIEGK